MDNHEEHKKRLVQERSGYASLFVEIKTRIQASQVRAILTVNSELIQLYWDIGYMIDARQKHEGWGAGVIPRLARELKNEMPELKGFSERNIKRMLSFFRAYPDPELIVPQAASQLHLDPTLKQPGAKTSALAKLGDGLLWSIPWFHHVVLMEKVKDLSTRLWYIEQTLVNGWSRNILSMQIETQVDD